eukprot:COSAG06_NODE_463_length_15376_cov_6.319369_7_plen_72_part_00
MRGTELFADRNLRINDHLDHSVSVGIRRRSRSDASFAHVSPAFDVVLCAVYHRLEVGRQGSQGTGRIVSVS